MSESVASPGREPSTQATADQIRELLRIDKDVSELLKTASLAVKDLTNTPAISSEESNRNGSSSNGTKSPIDEAKQAFKEHTTNYFTLIQSLSERLHRQVHALEKAGIITAETHAAEAQPLPPPQPSAARTGQAPVKVDPPMQITNGGLGNLDVGWLNSRRDVVGKQKEAELWAEARRHLENIQGRSAATAGPDDMNVDAPSP